MTHTGPFAEDTPQLLTRSHTQVVTATLTLPDATTIPLTLTGGTLTSAEDTAPRVTADLDCVVPDQTTLARVDPRTGARVVITAGYTREGGAQDVAALFDLGARRRRVTRTATGAGMTLGVSGDEALVIDASPVFGGTVSASSRTQAMRDLLTAALEPDPIVTATIADATATTVTDLTDRWATIDDLADQIDADVYDDGTRHWWITPRPVAATDAAAVLRVGPGGNLTDTDATLDRDAWANQVKVRYRWRDAGGTEHVVIGTGTVTTGPYAPATAGLRVYPLEREVPTTQAAANAAAQAILRRMLSRSRSYRVSAPAAWWLRAGDTVTVQLVTGGQERHIVQSVVFDLAGGTMTVTTRLPDTLTVIGE
jgi:hypothetical protein